MLSKIVIIACAAAAAAIALFSYKESRGSTAVQARVAGISERCYLRLKDESGLRASALAPCADRQALGALLGSGKAEVVRTRTASLLFTSPANGRPITVPVAEARFSATPLKVGDVLTIRSDIRYAARVTPN